MNRILNHRNFIGKLQRVLLSDVSNKIQIYEVGPRDGLQNQSKFVSTEEKIKFIDALSLSGLKEIEVTSIVSPKVIPQLADYEAVLKNIKKKEGVTYTVLVPNLKGLTRALDNGITTASVVTSASDTFSKKNMNCTIEESMGRISEMMSFAEKNGMKLRGYISNCFYCPYEQKIDSEVVLNLSERLAELGCYEIVICDTLGAARPNEVGVCLEKVVKKIPPSKIAVHFHNTYKNAIPNINKSLEFGVRKIDSSSGGLGGCPFAVSATGNVGTEDVIKELELRGYKTGVDINKILEATRIICHALVIDPPSDVAAELLLKS